jgi:hypothetical protein
LHPPDELNPVLIGEVEHLRLSDITAILPPVEDLSHDISVIALLKRMDHDVFDLRGKAAITDLIFILS